GDWLRRSATDISVSSNRRSFGLRLARQTSCCRFCTVSFSVPVAGVTSKIADCSIDTAFGGVRAPRLYALPRLFVGVFAGSPLGSRDFPWRPFDELAASQSWHGLSPPRAAGFTLSLAQRDRPVLGAALNRWSRSDSANGATLVLASSATWAQSKSRRPAVGRGHPLFNLFSGPALRVPGRMLVGRKRACAGPAD